jgi:hypothetical protein
MGSQRHNRLSLLLRCSAAALILGISTAACFGVAKADSTDDYPIPHRIIVTSCTAEQLLAAGRVYKPVYYERYMIDMHNKPLDIQQATKDKIHWFLSLSPADRRAYSDGMYHNGVEPLWRRGPITRSSSTTRVLPPQKPTTAPTTRPMTNPCGTGHPPDDKSACRATSLKGLVQLRSHILPRGEISGAAMT